jgi:DSF synthase
MRGEEGLVIKSHLRFLAERYDQLEVRYDPEQRTLWCLKRPRTRPCFNPDLLSEIRRFQEAVQSACRENDEDSTPVRFLVWGSRIRDTYNLGGDLQLFTELIRSRDREGLRRYAVACIDVLHPNSIDLGCPLTTITLVQGAALGGGFEAAISSSVVVAEKQAQMGMPEIMFNLFPGMGAFSFLSRRMHPFEAERMILSGDLWTAEQLYAKGVVDVLAETGGGEQAVMDYIHRQERVGNGTAGIHRVRRRVSPIDYEELLDVALIWAETALRLKDRDLRVMERLVRAQNRLADAGNAAPAVVPSNVVSVSF